MRTITLHTGRKVSVGMRPTPRNQLARARAFDGRMHARHFGAAPASCLNSAKVHDFDTEGNGPSTPQDGSYTGEPLGDCAVACPANAFKVLSLCAGQPEIEILAKDCVAWYLAYTCGSDDGGIPDDVLTRLQSVPMLDAQGQPHTIAGHSAVDWHNPDAVHQALYGYHALDLGVDSSALEGAMGDTNGWIVTGVQPLSNYDHSVPTFDYGTAGELADMMKVNLNGQLGQDDPAVSLETWGTIGIVEWQSWVNLTGEAWVIEYEASPTPIPAPVPVVPPAPPLPPIPEPCGIALTALIEALASFGGIAGVDQDRLRNALNELRAAPQ